MSLPAGAILRAIRNKYLWLAVSLLVYTFGISGGVYDIIRHPAPFMMKQDGTLMWFHPQVRYDTHVREARRQRWTAAMRKIDSEVGPALVHVCHAGRAWGWCLELRKPTVWGRGGRRAHERNQLDD